MPGAGASCSILSPSGAAGAAIGAVNASIPAIANPRKRIFWSPPAHLGSNAQPITEQWRPPVPCRRLGLLRSSNPEPPSAQIHSEGTGNLESLARMASAGLVHRERLCRLVVLADIASDGVLEIGNRFEDAAADAPAGDGGEEALDG